MSLPPIWLGSLGRWLVVQDALEPARAIVVLGGHFPVRATEAAALFGHGLAPEVWVTRPIQTSDDVVMLREGIATSGEQRESFEVLKRTGVPSTAIRPLSNPVLNTEAELRVIAHELRKVGGERVILVTSKAHTRRVKAIWKAVVGEHPRAVVRYSSQDPYDPNSWWRNLQDVLAVGHETFGLLNVWARFPYRPTRPRE